jgi:hypothetical protein
MRKILIISIFILSALSTVNAQFFKESDVDIYKKDVAKQAEDIVKENLDLTKDQAKIFWPIYNEYHEKTDAVLDEELKVLEDYLMHYYILDDEKAKELVIKSINLKIKRIDLQKEYLSKMADVLPATVVGKFYQIDNRINLMINQQTTDRIPLVRDQDKN